MQNNRLPTNDEGMFTARSCGIHNVHGGNVWRICLRMSPYPTVFGLCQRSSRHANGMVWVVWVDDHNAHVCGKLNTMSPSYFYLGMQPKNLQPLAVYAIAHHRKLSLSTVGRTDQDRQAGQRVFHCCRCLTARPSWKSCPRPPRRRAAGARPPGRNLCTPTSTPTRGTPWTGRP